MLLVTKNATDNPQKVYIENDGERSYNGDAIRALLTLISIPMMRKNHHNFPNNFPAIFPNTRFFTRFPTLPFLTASTSPKTLAVV